ARTGPGRRLCSTLRSPRLVAWLLVIVTCWLVLGTLVPQTSMDAAKSETWARAHPTLEPIASALGLHAAYTQPFFVMLMFLLAASTAICAWERTRHAARMSTTKGSITPAQLNRLRNSESIDLPAEEHADPQASLVRAAASLRSLGLRGPLGPRLLESSSGLWGLWGSPVFHWALVALIVLIPLGRLTRAEGLMGVVAGSSRVDAREAYGLVDEGPLHSRFTGLDIGVEPGIDLSYDDDGIDRGPAPVVTLSRDGQVLAEQRVYPNRPLRYGSLTVHMSELGVGAAYSLVTSDSVVLKDQALIDVIEGDSRTYTPYSTSYGDGSGAAVVSVTVGIPDDSSIPIDDSEKQRRQVSIVATGPAGDTVALLAGVGDTIDLGGGLGMQIDAVDYYARLSVVDDWSVDWIYALFAIAVLSVSVSVLVPHRVARVYLDTAVTPPVLRLDTRHSRSSPEFHQKVREALEGERTEES
ncbi:MAG: cytochrome c biogenesis protein ResB, partial [Coriobacteriia bacterium]|nr:cytochrome c biogenesis protein ResB [Coriobacteriia bacterium]